MPKHKGQSSYSYLIQPCKLNYILSEINQTKPSENWTERLKKTSLSIYEI